MFVYINGSTENFNIVSDLPEKAEFTTNNAIKEFWLVNGCKKLNIDKIGIDSIPFKAKLNPRI